MISAFQVRPRKRWPLPCWPIKRGTSYQVTCLRRLARSALRSSGKFPMSNHRGHRGALSEYSYTSKLLRVPPLWLRFLFLLFWASLVSCTKPPDPHTLVMIIKSSTANLDPRVGTDAQSERI